MHIYIAKFELPTVPYKKQGLKKPRFAEHGVVKEVRTIFMNEKDYVYIPDLRNNS